MEQKKANQYYTAFREGWFSVFRPVNLPFRNKRDYRKGLQRDAENIASDWRRVGDALRVAMDRMR